MELFGTYSVYGNSGEVGRLGGRLALKRTLVLVLWKILMKVASRDGLALEMLIKSKTYNSLF